MTDIKVMIDIKVSKRETRLLKQIPMKISGLFKYLQCDGYCPELTEMRLSYDLHSLNHGLNVNANTFVNK